MASEITLWKPMHVASEGHVSAPHPKIVQYPSGYVVSHVRWSCTEQSLAFEQESPISG